MSEYVKGNSSYKKALPGGRALPNSYVAPILPSVSDRGRVRDLHHGFCGPGRDPRDPNGPHAIANLAAGDRSEDGSNSRLHTGGGPNVLPSIGSAAHSGPNNHRPRHSPDPAPVRVLRNAMAAVRFRCIFGLASRQEC
jgi:hypothetical protein